jgi:hypothetical protein
VKLSADRAIDYATGNTDPETDEYTVELNVLLDTSRWSSIHQLVLKDADGKFWMTTYTRGLTENQDEQAFDDCGEVTFDEAEKMEVVAWEYRKK